MAYVMSQRGDGFTSRFFCAPMSTEGIRLFRSFVNLEGIIKLKFYALLIKTANNFFKKNKIFIY